MCLRTRDDAPVPDEVKLWGGDDWLIMIQRRPPAALIRTPFRTDMSTTTRAEEFQRMFLAEREATDRLLAPLQGSRWWHRAQHLHEVVRNEIHLRTGR